MKKHWQRKQRDSSKPGPKERRPYVYVEPDDRKMARQVFDIVYKNKSTALDTEFPPDGPRKNEAIIWSLSGAHGQRFVLHGEWLRDGSSPFIPWLADKRTRLVYFNFNADADVVEQNAGIDIEPSFYADAYVLGWLRNNSKFRYALKDEGKDYLKWNRDGQDYAELFSYLPRGKKKRVTVSPDVLLYGPLPEEMLEVMSHEEWIELFKHYSADDAEETHDLFRQHKYVLLRWGYWPNYLRINGPYTITLRHFQKRGIPIDMAALEDLNRRVTINLLREQTCIRAMAGKPDLNLSPSAQDLRKLVFSEWGWPTYEDLMTKGGKDGSNPQPQLSKRAWARYAKDEGFAFAERMLEYNKYSKRKGTFITGIGNGVKYGPGADINRLMSSYNQIGTKTGRMASRKFKVKIKTLKHYKTRPPKEIEKTVKAGMNMLNFPNAFNDEDGVRAVVVPPPPDEHAPEGYDLIVADESGFELYTTLWSVTKHGIKSRMLKELKNGVDVHSLTAKHVCELDCDWQDVKRLYPDKRNAEGKRCNFNLLYGGGARMLCRIMGWDERDERNVRKAQRMIDIWQDLYPEMPRYQKMIVEEAYELGYVTTIAGRRLQLKAGLMSSDDGIVHHYENMAKNGPSQGSAADIIQVAQNAIEADDELRRKFGYQQAFNVYDEVVGWARKKYSQEALKRVTWHMERPFADQCPVGKWPVEGKVAANWRAAK